MDILASLFNGILIALEPINLGLAVIGVIVGLVCGGNAGSWLSKWSSNITSLYFCYSRLSLVGQHLQ